MTKSWDNFIEISELIQILYFSIRYMGRTGDEIETSKLYETK